MSARYTACAALGMGVRSSQSGSSRSRPSGAPAARRTLLCMARMGVIIDRAGARAASRTAPRTLRAGEASSAVGLLLAARRVLGDRGDVALPLAAALDLAGEDAAALETWRALGARGPALLTGSEAWLRELGYEPPQ